MSQSSEFSSEDISSECSEIVVKDDINECCGDDKLNTLKRLKWIAIILIFGLFLSIVVMLSLGVMNVYLLTHSDRSSDTIDISDRIKRYRYPILSSYDGVITFSGHIFSTEPIDENKKNIVFENERNSIFVYENDIENQQYEVNSEVFCCPLGVKSENVNSQCRKESTNEIWRFLGKNEEEARSIFTKSNLFLSKGPFHNGKTLCQAGEEVTHTIEEVKKSTLAHHHCHAQCIGSTMEQFIGHNPNVVTEMLAKAIYGWKHSGDEESEKPTKEAVIEAIQVGFLEHYDPICKMQGAQGDTKNPVTGEDAVLNFKVGVDRFCGDFASFDTPYAGKLTHLCSTDESSVECRQGDCWDEAFHDQFDFVEE